MRSITIPNKTESFHLSAFPKFEPKSLFIFLFVKFILLAKVKMQGIIQHVTPTADRQLDITYSNGFFFTIPPYTKGRIEADDFIFFHWGKNIDPDDYVVVVESLDTASDTYRSIGKLSEQVKLPFVQYSPYAKLLLLPHRENMPKFISNLSRGTTYIIPSNVPKTAGGDVYYQMKRSGGKT